jgi:hypothetical protein
VQRWLAATGGKTVGAIQTERGTDENQEYRDGNGICHPCLRSVHYKIYIQVALFRVKMLFLWLYRQQRKDTAMTGRSEYLMKMRENTKNDRKRQGKRLPKPTKNCIMIVS